MLIHPDMIYFGFCLRAATQLQLTKERHKGADMNRNTPKLLGWTGESMSAFYSYPVGNIRKSRRATSAILIAPYVSLDVMVMPKPLVLNHIPRIYILMIQCIYIGYRVKHTNLKLTSLRFRAVNLKTLTI